MPYETVIGLEVHAQLSTRSKIFCAADAAFGGPPNAHTCTVDLGLPGVLPVLNRRAVEYTLRLGLAVGGEIAPRCRFARKHYFYPDLPKGYQISQYEEPICRGGEVRILPKGGGERRVRLTRIHMEEDAGKLIHGEELGDPFHSYVDFNRAGVPLLEIVTEPDLRSPEEAEAFLRKLRTLVRYLGICDGNMQEGSLRCDANISLRPRGSEKLGAKVEIKNMNSFRHLRRALEHEEARQREALDAGRPIPQETRLWNDAQGVTIGMRSKEYAHDYRYFPEPDLVPLAVGREWLEEIQKSLPELPDARRARFVADYGLPAYDAEVLTEERALADYYEAAVRAAGKGRAKAVSNWVMGEFLRLLNEKKIPVETMKPEDYPVSPENTATIVELIDEELISGTIAKSVYEETAKSGKNPRAIVEEKGLTQISDAGALAQVVEQVLAAHPNEVAAYKGGKTQLLGFFTGQAMKKTGGKANPQALQAALKEKLG